MFTAVHPCLLLFSFIYPCLPCLPMFTHVSSCLSVFTLFSLGHLFLPLFTLVNLCLSLITHVYPCLFMVTHTYQVSTIPGLWTGPWTGPLTHSSSGSDQLISLLYYCLADLHLFLIQDASHLNNIIYDKHLTKSFHGADVDDDLDRFYLAG